MKWPAPTTAILCCLALFSVGFGDECPPEDGPVTCKACERGDDVNALDGIPRINRQVFLVSSNLGAYDPVYTCSEAPEGSDPDCKLAEVDTSAVLGGSGADKSNIVSWGESLAIYAAFAIFLAVAFGTCTCCTLVLRHFCCCCCGRYGTCGQSQPTLWEGHGCLRLGFEVLPVEALPLKLSSSVVPAGGAPGGEASGEPLDPAKQEELAKQRVAYPPRSRWLTRGLLVLYASLVIIFVIVGQERGNYGLTEAQKTLAAAPTGVMQSVQSLAMPTQELVIDVASNVIATGLLAMNGTITAAVSVPALQQNMDCVVQGLGGRLPSPAAQIAFVDDLLAQTGAVNTSLRQVEADLAALNASVVQGNADVAQGQALFSDIEAVEPQLQGNLTLLRGALGRLHGNASIVASPSSGANATADDVDSLSLLPSAADANAGAGAFDAAERDQDSGGDTASAEWGRRDANVGTLTSLNASFAAFAAAGGDLGRLADNLEALNAAQAALVDTSGDVAVVGNATEAVAAITASLPTTQALNASLQAIRRFVEDVPVPVLLASMDALNGSLLIQPNFTILQNELDALDALLATSACASAVLQGVQGLNESIVQVPDVFSSLNSSFEALVDTRDSAAAALDEAQEAAANATQEALDSVEVLNNASLALNASYNASRPENLAIDLASKEVELEAFGDGKASVNASSGGSLAALSDSRDTLADPDAQANGPFIAALRNASSIVATATAALSQGLADYIVWHEAGRCSLDLSIVCDEFTAGSCAALGPCITGTKVCADSATSCTSDAPCGGSACLFQNASFVAAEAALTSYATVAPGLAPPAALPGALRASGGAVASLLPTLARAQNDTRDLQDAIGDIDPASTVTELQSVSDELSAETLGFEGVQSTIAAAQAAIDLDVSSLTGNAADTNGTVEQVRELEQQAADADAALDELAAYLFTAGGMASDVALLSETRLRGIAEEQGLRALLIEVAEVADSFLNTTNSIAEGLAVDGSQGDNGSFIGLSVEGELNASSVLDRVDAIATDRYSRHGPYHFLLAVYNPPSESCIDGIVCAVDPETVDTSGGALFRNAAGEEWADGRWCVTLHCINNQIDEWNKGPLTDSEDFAFLPLTVSREAATFLPYLIPLLMAFTALVPALVLAGKHWHSYPMCASMLCISCCAPIIFVLIGALFFPLIIAGHDFCRGGANAMYTAAQASSHGVCVNFVGGTYNTTTGACLYDATGSGNVVEVDVASTLGALLGDCDAFPNVVEGLYAELQASVAARPVTEVNATIKSSQGSPGAIRENLAAVLRRAAGNSSDALGDFIGRMQGSLGCTALNDRGVHPVKEAFCCDGMTSLYWLVASWYLIGFSQCMCGWGGSILGFKRLPNRLWGDQFEDVVEDEISKQLQQDAIARRRLRAAGTVAGLAAAAGAASANVPPSPDPTPARDKPAAPASAAPSSAKVVKPMRAAPEEEDVEIEMSVRRDPSTASSARVPEHPPPDAVATAPASDFHHSPAHAAAMPAAAPTPDVPPESSVASHHSTSSEEEGSPEADGAGLDGPGTSSGSRSGASRQGMSPAPVTTGHSLEDGGEMDEEAGWGGGEPPLPPPPAAQPEERPESREASGPVGPLPPLASPPATAAAGSGGWAMQSSGEVVEEDLWGSAGEEEDAAAARDQTPESPSASLPPLPGHGSVVGQGTPSAPSTLQ